MRHAFAATMILVAAATASCTPGADSSRVPSTVDAPSMAPGDAKGGEITARIPDSFLGRWASAPELCSDESGDTEAMTVAPTELTFWEASAHVLSVTPQSELQVALKIEYADNVYVEDPVEDAAESEILDVTFTLSADRRTLQSIYEDRITDVRHRCQDVTTSEEGGAHAA